jgi:tetratricopeptide (TPR) repeat protein
VRKWAAQKVAIIQLKFGVHPGNPGLAFLGGHMEPVSIEDLQGEITHLRNKVDSIAEENQAANKPWFKNISTGISVAALLFSFGTTIISYKRANDQDIHSLKSELRGILQRLAALPKENIEIYQKYASEPSSIATISGYLNQENLLLSKQANEIIKRLPKTQVSSIDYMAVATALAQSREYAAAILNFNSALTVASTLDDETATLRVLATLEMQNGKTGDARLHFQQALDLFKKKYESYDDFTKNSVNFLTELYWASAEAWVRNMEAATQHLNSAEQLLKKLPEAPQTQVFKGQLDQMTNRLFARAEASSPNPPPAPNSSQFPAFAPETGMPQVPPPTSERR